MDGGFQMVLSLRTRAKPNKMRLRDGISGYFDKVFSIARVIHISRSSYW